MLKLVFISTPKPETFLYSFKILYILGLVLLSIICGLAVLSTWTIAGATSNNSFYNQKS